MQSSYSTAECIAIYSRINRRRWWSFITIVIMLLAKYCASIRFKLFLLSRIIYSFSIYYCVIIVTSIGLYNCASYVMQQIELILIIILKLWFINKNSFIPADNIEQWCFTCNSDIWHKIQNTIYGRVEFKGEAMGRSSPIMCKNFKKCCWIQSHAV